MWWICYYYFVVTCRAWICNCSNRTLLWAHCLSYLFSLASMWLTWYVSDRFHLILIWNCKHLNKFIGIVMKKWIMNKLITGPIFGSQEKWTVEAFHTLNSGHGSPVMEYSARDTKLYLFNMDANKNKIICPRHHYCTWSISWSW